MCKGTARAVPFFRLSMISTVPRLLLFFLFIYPCMGQSQNPDKLFLSAQETYFQFQYSSCVKDFQKARALYLAKGDTRKVLKCYYYIAMAQFELGQINDALDELYEGSGISIEKYGEESPESGDFYIAYGRLYQLNASYDTAKMFYLGAAQLKTKQSGSLDLGELYAYLASSYDYNGQYDSALICYDRSAEIMEKHLGLYHPYTEWIYASVPYVADQLGNHQRELEAALKSLEINRRLWGDESEYVATSYVACATAYQHLGKYPEEKDCAQKALDIKVKLFGVNSLEAATAYYDLGNAHARLNQFDVAIAYQQKAYLIKKKMLGEKDQETLKILRNIGNIYFDGGFYEKSLSFYVQHLELQQKLHKSNDPGLIQPLKDVAQASEQAGQLKEARDIYQQINRIQADNASHKYQLADTYIALGRIQDELSDPKGAIEHLERALECNRLYNADLPAEKAFIYNNMATVYSGMNEYEKAKQLLNEAFAIRKAVFGTDSPEAAQSLSNLASVHVALEQYTKAEEYYEQCLIIYENYYGRSHGAVARLLVNMATLKEKQGDLKGEIDLLKRAEAMNMRLTGAKSPDLYTVYFNLAVAYSGMAQHEDAFESLNKAQAIAEGFYGKDAYQMADIYNMRGNLKHQAGQSYEAFPFYERAITIYRSVYGSRHTRLADSYNNIGLTYLALNEHSKARRYLEESIKMYQELLGTANRETVSTRMNLGNVEIARSNYQGAIAIFEESLQRGLETFDSQHPFIATLYQNLGVAYTLSSRDTDALEAHHKCLHIRRTLFGGTSLEVAKILNNLSAIYLKIAELHQAKSHIAEALKIYRGSIGEKSELIARAINIQADIAHKEGSYSMAIALAEDAIRANLDASEKPYDYVQYFISQVKKVDNSFLLYQQTENQAYLISASDYLAEANDALKEAENEILSEEDQFHFSIWKSLLTNVGVKNALALYNLTSEARHLEEALYYAERSKANVLLNALKKSNALEFEGLDERLVLRKRELQAALQKVDEELFRLEHKGTQYEQRINALKSQLFEWENEIEQVTKQLEVNPRYQEIAGAEMIVSLNQIQEKYIHDEHEVIVEYAMSDSTLHTFVITKSNIVAFSKPYEEQLDNLVVALRNAVVYKSEGAFNYISGKLYDLLLGDVEDYFKARSIAVDKLTIVPEGPLNYLPFESLKRAGRFMIEDYDIRYTYSLSLAKMIRERSGLELDNSCLAFAPVFADAGTNKITSGARDIFQASRAVAGETMPGFSENGENIAALPGTEMEVNAIDKLMESRGHRTELFIYASAKEDVVKSGALEKHKYVHFATHGFVNEANPAFSGIFMSQNTESDEDCILFASEIYNLKLNAELVTLSACETALGRMAYGEGIVGLTRAFLYAGAKNLLVSQWKVNDESTARMMVDFYSRMLDGTSKSTALREAKLALIADPTFSKPYYWAPFILIGE